MASHSKTVGKHHINTIKPALKAYAFGYLASTGPRLPGWLRLASSRKLSLEQKLKLLYVILTTSLEWHRLPTSCALIVGAVTLASRLLLAIFSRFGKDILRLQSDASTRSAVHRCLTIVVTLSTSCAAFELLNKDTVWARRRSQSLSSSNPPSTGLLNLNPKPAVSSQGKATKVPPKFKPAGRTLLLTLFLLTRALDVTYLRCLQRLPRSRSAARVMRRTDIVFFALSCVPIMHSWFYMPERLPRSYTHWITQAAAVDQRLIQALKYCRTGDFVYGEDTGKGELLKSLCRELNLPTAWGDPSITVPVPCEVVHCGNGPSCEYNALSRFMGGWLFAIRLYLPLQLLGLARNIKDLNAIAIIRATLQAARSSAFLGGFIGSFWYAVCLSRTRIGPLLFSYATVTPQMWDSGLCVLAGCFACGWSILLEKQARRLELMLFVMARALATILPRVYDRSDQWKERLAFMASTGVLVDVAMHSDPKLVRGIFGRVLQNVFR